MIGLRHAQFIVDDPVGKAWSLEKEFDEKVSCIASTDGNYVVVLSEEDYFGKLVYLYNMNQYKIEILPHEN